MDTSTVTENSSQPASKPDVEAHSLYRLGTHLGNLLDPNFFNCADAEIVVAAGGDETGSATVAVPVHRCILSARSPFFLNHFSSLHTAAGEKPRLELAKLVPGGEHIGHDALLAVLCYMYTGLLKRPLTQVCVDHECKHEACRPAIDGIVQSMYAATGFKIPELVSLFKRCLSDIMNVASNEGMVPIIHVAFTCQIEDLLNQCVQMVATSSTFNSMYLEKELPGDIYTKIKEMRLATFPEELNHVIVDSEHEMSIRNIHLALDSHDVDHVQKILKESTVTLDDAFALHYAALHCAPNVVSGLLNLESINVNLKNKDGYTPLHMACIRQEPGIILSLIKKGSSVLERTPDGHDALTICKRLAKEKYFHWKWAKSRKTYSAYLCVGILEQKINMPSCTLDLINREVNEWTPLLFNNFYESLLYLEIRVELAKCVFPSEAMLAMGVEGADSIEEYCTGTYIRKRKEVSPNENTTMQNKRLRCEALARTVQLGKMYFPTCSEAIDELIFKEPIDFASFEYATTEDNKNKRKRYYEQVKSQVLKALNKDKAAAADITSTTSSSSTLRPEMVTPGGSLNADSADAPALPFGPCSQAPGTPSTGADQLQSQCSDVAEDNRSCVGSKTKLKSKVWDEIEKINVGGGDWKGQCRWCKQLLSASSRNGTQHLHRHLRNCKAKKAAR